MQSHLKIASPGSDEAASSTTRPTSTASSISAFSDISAPAEPVAENGNRSDPVPVRAASASIAPTLDSTQGPTSDEGSSSEEEEDSASVREARRLAKGKYPAIGTPPGSPIRRFGPNPAATRATRTQIGKADAHIPVRPLTIVPEAAEVQTVPGLSAVIDKAAKFQDEGLIPDVAVVPESESEDESEDERDELLPTDDDDAAVNDNVSHVSDSEDERAELRWGVIRPGTEDALATQGAMAVDTENNATNLLARLDDALALNGPPATSPTESELFGAPEQPHTPSSSPGKPRYSEVTLRRLQESEAHREELRRQKYEAAKAERTRVDAFRLDALADSLTSAFGATGSANNGEMPVDVAALLTQASPHPPSRDASPAVPFTRSGAPSPASSQFVVELSPPRAVDPDVSSARPSPESLSPSGRSKAPRWPLPQRKRPREAQEGPSVPPVIVAADVQNVAHRPRIPLPSRRRTQGAQEHDAAGRVRHAGNSHEATSAAALVIEQRPEGEVGSATEPSSKRAKVEKIITHPAVKAEGVKKEKVKAERVKKEKSKTKKARNARVARASIALTRASSSRVPPACNTPAVRIHRGPLLAWVIDWVNQLERMIFLLESKKTANDLPNDLLLVLATITAHVNHPDFTVHTKDGFMLVQCKKLVELLHRLREDAFWEEHVQRPEAWGPHRQQIAALLHLLRRTWFPRSSRVEDT
ncbi:uncharacterized protein SCHCODRAFT_02624137 [Schizophyllum commune H4-8]|uniref:uncharacterized protein n=1 Tax=Schizophyllum commune (strain H4-8 / FGSC 9210) TaxID=578458 RepID=UPI00216080F4|nr:uncharacterized protein SCHCODRAFT_02624137 [Schizophyllum commune H4-8]KAI5894241.1 hypothetical protein SCHCODRAFT_02624137 [Schizophyllum commune H4-8]